MNKTLNPIGLATVVAIAAGILAWLGYGVLVFGNGSRSVDEVMGWGLVLTAVGFPWSLAGELLPARWFVGVLSASVALNAGLVTAFFAHLRAKPE